MVTRNEDGRSRFDIKFRFSMPKKELLSKEWLNSAEFFDFFSESTDPNRPEERIPQAPNAYWVFFK